MPHQIGAFLIYYVFVFCVCVCVCVYADSVQLLYSTGVKAFLQSIGPWFNGPKTFTRGQ